MSGSGTAGGEFVPDSGTGRRSRRILYVGDFADGSRLMVELWPDGTVTAATKPARAEGQWTDPIWGPPITLIEEE